MDKEQLETVMPELAQKELWRFTNLTPLAAYNWHQQRQAVASSTLAYPRAESTIVFVNGCWDDSLSHIPKGVHINLTLKELVIDIPAETKLKTTLHLHFIHQGEEVLSTPHLVLNVGKYAEVTLLETSATEKESDSVFEKSTMKINLSEGASLTHLKRQLYFNSKNFPFSFHQVEQSAHSNYHSFILQQGGEIGRHSLLLNLNGREARATLHGLYALRGTQQSDLYLQVNHNAPQTYSDQYYKGILDDESHAVFQGEVIIHPGSQEIASTQLNKNLLLSNKAHIDTQPRLEINADDVKCSHGATIGQLSSEELFYMQARGIPKEKAQSLLAFGFANEVITQIPDPHGLKLTSYFLEPFQEHFKTLHIQ